MSTLSEDDAKAVRSLAPSNELVLGVLGLVGDPAVTKESNPKNVHLLGVFVGVDIAETGGFVCARSLRIKIELRLLGDTAPSVATLTLEVRSNTAPAVLGRELTFVRGIELPMMAAESRSRYVEFATDTMDEMLPDTEWPGRTVLAVSVETRDNGRGINSSVSENPTRARVAGFGLRFGRD